MKFTAEQEEAPVGASLLWRVCAKAIEFWAYFGGVLLLVITGLEAYNAVVKLTTGTAASSEHELVKYMVGIAIFTFLPYCQYKNGHIAVDIFTEGASAWLKLLMSTLGLILAAAICVVLLKQMYLGMYSYIDYREVTAVLKLPIWTAFPFVLASLALWLVACVMCLYSNALAYKALKAQEA